MSLYGEKLIDIFEALSSSGVVFYYSDDCGNINEITEITEVYHGKIEFLLNDEWKEKTSLMNFKDCHSKENVNLYDWQDIREFDQVLEKICEENTYPHQQV